MTQQKVKFTREYLEFHVNMGYIVCYHKRLLFFASLFKKIICEAICYDIGQFTKAWIEVHLALF